MMVFRRVYITGKQAKAARYLAGLTQEQLAKKAGLSRQSIVYMEGKTRMNKGHSIECIIAALEQEGVKLELDPFNLSQIPKY